MNLSNFAGCISFVISQKDSLFNLLILAAVVMGTSFLLSFVKLLSRKKQKSLTTKLALYSIIILSAITLSLLALGMYKASDEIVDYGAGSCGNYPINNLQAENYESMAIFSAKLWLIAIIALIFYSIWNKFIKNRPETKKALKRIKKMSRIERLVSALILLSVVLVIMFLIAW